VRRHHADTVHELRFAGVEQARPTEEFVSALRDADLVVIAPSNPFLSVAPILALPGLLTDEGRLPTRAPVVAVSPIVGGAALRGPADAIIVSLGGEASAVGIARHYTQRYPRLLDALVIDRLDEAQLSAVEEHLPAHVTDTVMRSSDDRQRLAADVLAFGLARAQSR
jgi:LPPG:FO 2-phospho-L-lactate transferase